MEGYAAALRLHGKYGIPASLHLSGTLIETLAWHYPWFLELVRDLREKGLISLIGGTYSENVMPLFEPSFNSRQLDEFLWLYRRHLRRPPEEVEVCWVPERVWDTEKLAPTLTSSELANGGYRLSCWTTGCSTPPMAPMRVARAHDSTRSDRLTRTPAGPIRTISPLWLKPTGPTASPRRAAW